MNLTRAQVFLSLLLLITGCASTHGLKPVATLRSPEQLQAAQTFGTAAVRTDAWPVASWWQALADPQLDALISEGLKDSPTLEVAAARTRAALAEAGIGDAERLPQLSGLGDVTRAHFSGNGFIPPPYAGTTQDLDTLQASLSWHVDLWGGGRAQFNSALDLAKASAIDADAARLTLSSSIASTYIELQHDYLLLDVAQATLAQREQVTSLTRDRNAAGLDSRLELKQTEETLPATREAVIQLQENIEHTRHALAALLGAGPDRGLSIERPGASALVDPALPSQLPAELLGRRPDLEAQRLRVGAAAEAIKVRKAAFYPNVDLIAFAGFQRLGPGALLNSGERQIGAGPALTLPLFDAGERRARLSGADAAYDAAVAQYNQSLADALRDVADQISATHSVSAQRSEQQLALASAQEAYDLAVLRYREGVGNYLQVLVTEEPLLAQRQLAADLQARSLHVAVDLARALGGGALPAPVNALAAN